MSLIHSYGRLSNMECILNPIPKDFVPNSAGWWHGGFIVIEENDKILKLKSTNFEKNYPEIRIKIEGFIPIGKPTFIIGDKVFVAKKNKAGTIYSVTYHDKRGCFRYMLDYGDRKSTCWYFDEDLQKQEQTL